MNEDFRVAVATVYGEAGGSSPSAWRAVMSVIMNRVCKREWKKHQTPLAVIVNSRFDAYDQVTGEYKRAWTALGNGVPAYTTRLGKLVGAVQPIFTGEVKPITPAVLYYSPRAQAALHAKHPGAWPAVPRWDFGKLEEVFVAGAEQDDFRWFKYKAGA